MTGVCVRGRIGHCLVQWLAAVVLLGAAAAPALAAEPIVVQLDRARLIKLPENAKTVVIGDPLIADLSLQPGGLAVITGKGYGATNVVVLDHDGAVLTEQTVEVKGPADPTVIVYRGVKRETYSCTPQCERRITLGDDQDYFTTTLDQTTTRNSQAIAAASGGSGADNNQNNQGNNQGNGGPNSRVNAPAQPSQRH
jgi:Flp pilus assembly secretin CpaC